MCPVGRGRDRSRGRGGAAAAAWTPARLTGSILWLRDLAADITVATGISNWADASGSAHPLSQATAGSQPAYVAALVNGRPGGTGDGSNDWLFRSDLCGLADGGARTFWAVARIPVATTRTPIMGQGLAGTPSESLVIDPNTFGATPGRWGLYAQGRNYQTTAATDTGWHLHVLTVSTMAAGQSKDASLAYYIDDTLQTLNLLTAGSATWTTQAAWNQTAAFAFPAVGVASAASIVSGGILNAVMSAADRAALHAYFQTEAGVP